MCSARVRQGSELKKRNGVCAGVGEDTREICVAREGERTEERKIERESEREGERKRERERGGAKRNKMKLKT